MAEPMLSVSGLSKTITLHILHGAEVHPLRDVSFDLAPGEFLSIAGPSGAGKSSLLKCLNRTYLASAGAAMYRTAAGEVVDLFSAPEREIVALRREEITYVSQFLKAPPRVPAVDVVASVLVRRGVDVEEARGRAATMLGRLGIGPSLQSSYPALFSGGEQQRVNVAKAFVAPPRLLLLDEPTSALDPENRERVIEMLREAQSAGTAVIAIFHDLELIRRLSDRVLVLADGAGRVVAPDGDFGISSDSLTDELMEVSR
ncbi:MAG: phosphonate C-P lyase system protein PhnL [Dehalococcoidia bacterium]